ncbi:MAG: hypothetical protein IJ119_09955 [Clostridia bacterium]|nr:hypothetical protein [Clostridia bacterium]
MEKIIVATGHNDHDAGISLSEGKVNNELAAGWKLRKYRTIRRHIWRCLFRHLLLADFSIYRQ